MESSNSPKEPVRDALAVDWLKRMADGDESALACLFDSTSPAIFGLVRRILPDPNLAEETTLDVYLQAWRSSALYRPDRGSVRAWLCTMARSRAIDRLRGERSKREVPSEELTERFADPTPSLIERRDDVRSALSKLPDAQRRAIELAYLQGLTHPEIAEVLDRPLGTVKTQIRLGMTKLRSLLSPTFREDFR
ncbi:MAG: sigma-70 family RNA polymerase sigma factor [Planctomycetota bacterium]